MDPVTSPVPRNRTSLSVTVRQRRDAASCRHRGLRLSDRSLGEPLLPRPSFFVRLTSWCHMCGWLFCLTAFPAGARAERLDLSHFRLVFAETFSNLSVSAHGPGTRWIAHTPWLGDFGDAQFVDPRPGFPFGADRGGFRIEMRKTADGGWQSGLLASVDAAGKGFSQQYGYFEMKAKLPAGPGVWPAFWLDSISSPTSDDPSIEIDVIEHYGQFPANYNSTVTVWPKIDQTKKWSVMNINDVPAGSLASGFHTHGVLVSPDWTIFYFDRGEKWRVPTPPEHKRPLMILVDLGLGGGWPIDHTPTPSYMHITSIKAYAPAGSGRRP